MNDWDKILDDFARKCKGGAPDMTNPRHLALLRESLLKFGWKENATNEFIGNLRNGEEKYVGIDEYRVYLKPGEKAPEGVEVQTSTHKKKYYEKTPGSKNKKDDKKGDKKAEEEPLQLINHEDSIKQQATDKAIKKVLELLLKEKEDISGAGRFRLSKEDVKIYSEYLSKPPEERIKEQQENIKKREEAYGPISGEDVNNALNDMKESLRTPEDVTKKGELAKPKAFTALLARIKKKGDPPGEYTLGTAGTERVKKVVEHFLKTGGRSSVTGKTVAFSDSQLDHRVSLDNWSDPDQGPDGAHNWEWMEARFNQFKGAKTDVEVKSALIERGFRTDVEWQLEATEDELANYRKEELTSYWNEVIFKKNGVDNLSVAKIEDMSKDEINSLIKGWNRSLKNPSGKDNQDFIPRYGSRKVSGEVLVKQGFPKTKASVEIEYNRGGFLNPDPKDSDTWGWRRKPDGSWKQDPNPSLDQSKSDYMSKRGSGGQNISPDELKEKIVGILGPKGRGTIPTPLQEKAEDESMQTILKEITKRKSLVDILKGRIKDDPLAVKQKKKVVDKNVREWKKLNKEPKPKKEEKVTLKGKKKNVLTKKWSAWKEAKDIYTLQQWEDYNLYYKGKKI